MYFGIVVLKFLCWVAVILRNLLSILSGYLPLPSSLAQVRCQINILKSVVIRGSELSSGYPWYLNYVGSFLHKFFWYVETFTQWKMKVKAQTKIFIYLYKFGLKQPKVKAQDIFTHFLICFNPKTFFFHHYFYVP